MVYATQNYWVSGLCPPSGILNTRKRDVSQTGSVSVLRGGEGDTYSVGSEYLLLPSLKGADVTDMSSQESITCRSSVRQSEYYKCLSFTCSR
jgi:hypothetical protein